MRLANNVLAYYSIDMLAGDVVLVLVVLRMENRIAHFQLISSTTHNWLLESVSPISNSITDIYVQSCFSVGMKV